MRSTLKRNGLEDGRREGGVGGGVEPCGVEAEPVTATPQGESSVSGNRDAVLSTLPYVSGGDLRVWGWGDKGVDI